MSTDSRTIQHVTKVLLEPFHLKHFFLYKPEGQTLEWNHFQWVFGLCQDCPLSPILLMISEAMLIRWGKKWYIFPFRLETSYSPKWKSLSISGFCPWLRWDRADQQGDCASIVPDCHGEVGWKNNGQALPDLSSSPLLWPWELASNRKNQIMGKSDQNGFTLTGCLGSFSFLGQTQSLLEE